MDALVQEVAGASGSPVAGASDEVRIASNAREVLEEMGESAVKLESSDAASDAEALIQSLHGLGARRRVNATSRASYLRAGGYQSGS